jgi:hypothetical protein
MAHQAGDRREQGQVAAALLLQLQLAVLDGVADLVVGYMGAIQRRGPVRIVGGVGLLGAPVAQGLWEWW